MTPEEYEALPEGPPFYDYIRGEAIAVNKSKLRHQVIAMCLGSAMWDHCRKLGLGLVTPNTNVKLPTGDWVSPDITFLSNDRTDCYDESRGVIIGTPDL